MSEIDWSKAPAGTTHYQPNINGWQSGWIMAVEGRVFFWHEKWLIDDATLDETAIPRPSQTQWRGPEDGLPPVGTVCEAKYAEEWHRCTVVAHLKDHRGMTDAVFQAEDDWDFHQRPEMFRPLKSDKERAVEAAMGNWCRGEIVNTLEYRARKEFVENLYDAGLLRLPEEQS